MGNANLAVPVPGNTRGLHCVRKSNSRHAPKMPTRFRVLDEISPPQGQKDQLCSIVKHKDVACFLLLTNPGGHPSTAHQLCLQSCRGHNTLLAPKSHWDKVYCYIAFVFQNEQIFCFLSMLHAIFIALLGGGADEELESDSSSLSFVLQIPKTSAQGWTS